MEKMREQAKQRTVTLGEVLMHQPQAMNEAKGKPETARSLLQPMPLIVLGHPFGETLQEWKTGVPVDCGEPWERRAIEAAVTRGPHPTARAADAIALVHEDVAYQVKAGFSTIVLWDDIKHNLPPTFKVSPVAVIPQAGRRGRIILDLSFAVRLEQKLGQRRPGAILQEAVNDTTAPLAPRQPVREIGKVLPRVFEFMAGAPAGQEILLSKVDLSDGFWRIIVEEAARWNFCYVMPDPPGAPIRIVIPSALQMGWMESPQYFCTATETGRDFIQWLVDQKIDCPPHPLEKFMLPQDLVGTIDTKDATPTGEDPGAYSVNVYVDDYILAVIENQKRTLLRRIARATLYGVHSIFPPPEITKHEGGKDSVSIKKLEKGDATFLPQKLILGFMLDGTARTVRLPQEKANSICIELLRLLKKSRVPNKRFLSIVGKISNATRILPAAKGLMTPLYKALRGEPKMIGIGKHSELRTALADLRQIILSLGIRPTHVDELVQLTPKAAGTCDASSEGAGGVWLGASFPPTVWRVKWPDDVVQRYRQGIITNSDLEMAAIIGQMLILEQLMPMQRQHCLLFSDNTPAVSWTTNLVAKANSVVAARLLRALAMRSRTTEAALPLTTHWPGDQNNHADTASRSTSKFESGPHKGEPCDDDCVFLTLFCSTFYLPQKALWQLRQVPPPQLSLLISTLRGQTLPMQQWMFKPANETGGSGPHTVPTMDTVTRSFKPCQPPDAFKSSWASLPAAVRAFGVEGTRSEPTRLQSRFGTSARPMNWQDTLTHENRNEVAPTCT
jgi:hypothetical protein